MNSDRTGFFISFDGIDGCGKSTQSLLLAKYLRTSAANPEDIIHVREPGGTRVSDRLREILLDKDLTEITDRTEVLLYIASRVQLVEEIIRPALAAGKIVISDRFYDSTIAYQGSGRQLGFKQIEDINSWAIKGFKPDLTFILDVDPSVFAIRTASSSPSPSTSPGGDATANSSSSSIADSSAGAGPGPDRIESEAPDFFDRTRTGFLDLAKREPDRIVLIDGMKSISDIELEIRKIVNVKLGKESTDKDNTQDKGGIRNAGT